MTARTTEQKMLTVVCCAWVAIDAREPDAAETMAMMMVAWVTGSVLISKTNFMPGTLKGEAGLRASGEALRSVGGLAARGRECRNNRTRDDLPNSWKGS